MSNLFLRIIKVLLVPLSLLDLFTGIVGGAWLLFLGEWQFTLVALGAAFFASFVLSVPVMVSDYILALALLLRDKGVLSRLIAFPIFVLSKACSWSLLSVWIVFIFAFALGEVGDNAIYPFIFVAYFASVTPWARMAEGSSDPENLPFNTFFARLVSASILVGIGVFNLTVNENELIVMFSILMGVGFVLSLFGKKLGLDRLATV